MVKSNTHIKIKKTLKSSKLFLSFFIYILKVRSSARFIDIFLFYFFINFHEISFILHLRRYCTLAGLKFSNVTLFALIYTWITNFTFNLIRVYKPCLFKLYMFIYLLLNQTQYSLTFVSFFITSTSV